MAQEEVRPRFSPVFQKLQDDVHLIPPWEKDLHIEDINCPCRPTENSDDRKYRLMGMQDYIFLSHKQIKEITN